MSRSSILLVSVCAWVAACGGGGEGDAVAEASAPGTATLAWTAAPGPLVTGYRVYYGMGSRAYLQPRGAGTEVGRVHRHAVSGLSSGTVYYFAVTAIDDVGNESVYSNEASKLID